MTGSERSGVPGALTGCARLLTQANSPLWNGVTVLQIAPDRLISTQNDQ
jgi:hypothetical protein